VEALAARTPAGVDLSSATAVDVPVLQLLLSARRSFDARGVGFELADPSGVFPEACRQAGMDCSGGLRHE
jgi:anti-anti-sigma regulatory factor